MRASLTGLLVLLLISLACSQASPTPTSSVGNPSGSGPTTAPTRPYLMGIAGLIPRHYPNPSQEDWLDLYGHLNETGELLGVYTSWSDGPESEGQTPKIVETAFGLASRYGFTPVVALGYFNDNPAGGPVANLDFNDSAQRARAVQAAVAIAQTYHPPFLALGVEVNRIDDPTGFEAYVSLYKESYAAVKAVSPQTQVFPIFQYELLRGGTYFAGDQQNPPQWDLLDKFAGSLDLVGLTTYPFLLYSTPAELPENYYSELSAHTNKPIAFTEIGWPSAPLSAAPDSPYGGSPGEQADFVRRFFDLTSGLQMRIALWSFPHDVGPDFNPAFTSVSLRQNDGTPKPALAVWEEFARK